MGSFSLSNVYDSCLINQHHHEESVAAPCLHFVSSFKLKEKRGERKKHKKQVYKIIITGLHTSSPSSNLKHANDGTDTRNLTTGICSEKCVVR